MPRGQLTLQEMKRILLMYKKELHDEYVDNNVDSKWLANKYLNKIFDKIEEYRV